MKKLVTVILLSSALLLPNESVKASYSSGEQKVDNIEQVQYEGRNVKGQHHVKPSKKFYTYFYWMNKTQSHPTYTKKNKQWMGWGKVEQAPNVKPTEKVEDNQEQPPVEEPAPEVKPEPKPEISNPSVEEKPEASTSNLSAFEQAVFTLTNAERKKAGLQPLQLDKNLTKSAQAKSKDMSVNRYMAHTSPTYGSPFDQMKAFGVTYRSAAENIARGQQSPDEVVRAWMASPGHRENILTAKFTHIGLGHDGNGHYWTQQFIQK